MGTQISVKLSDRVYESAKEYATDHGFDSLQNLIRELLRERIFEGSWEGGIEPASGLHTAMASEASLARAWLSVEEDKAWAHLQRET